MGDLDIVIDAARSLRIHPRPRRWAHLSLCVLDAVFSIGARYTGTVRTCCRYAGHRGLDPYMPSAVEQPLDAFLADVDAGGPESFAAVVLKNRQRTSPRGGVLKAEAARRYAAELVSAGVRTFAELDELVTDQNRFDLLQTAMRRVPGNGTADVRLGYFWMVSGDDDCIKPDRMVLGWLAATLGRRVTQSEAHRLVPDAAAVLGHTPWELDHAIWKAQRSRRPVIPSDSAVVRRHRAHQGRWREEVLGLPPGDALPARNEPVDSMLPEQHDGVRAEDAGWNLMSEAAAEYTRTRVPEVERASGVVERRRLYRNLLSSQPLAFSLVGELRAHPDAALAVLAALSGRELVAFDRIGADGDRFALDGLQAEWAPDPKQHLQDRSAFDIAAATRTADGRLFLITVEVKYVDDFSRVAIEPDRYQRHLDALGLTGEAVAELGVRRSQFLRSVMLTASVQRSGSADDVLAVVLSRDDDRTARDVVDTVGTACPSIATAWWGHRRFLEAAGRHGKLADWANSVAARYLLPEEQA